MFAGDIRNFVPDGLYDVVICNGVLHYVEDKPPVISLMQGVTSAGGINVVSLWSTYSPVPECHESVPMYCDDEDGVVTSSYRDRVPAAVVRVAVLVIAAVGRSSSWCGRSGDGPSWLGGPASSAEPAGRLVRLG